MTENEENHHEEDGQLKRDLQAFLHAQTTLVLERRLEVRAIIRGLIWLVAFALAIRGFHKINPPMDNLYGYVENFYRTLELLTIHMPHEYPENLPMELQIARFALPLCTLWFALGTFLDYARQPLQAFSIMRLRAHVVVCGETPRAFAIARQAVLGGKKVVQIIEDEKLSKDLALDDVVPLVGFIDRSTTLARAGLGKAGALIVATGSAIVNVSVAIRAIEEMAKHKKIRTAPLSIIVECDDADMAAILDGSFANANGRVELRLLSPADCIARSTLPLLLPALGTPEQPGAMLMIGDGSDADILLLRVLRNAPIGFNLALAAADGAKWLRRLQERFPELPTLGSALAFDVAAGREMFRHAALTEWLARNAGCVTVIHAGKEEEAMAEAIAIRRFARDAQLPSGAVLVRDAGSGQVLDALALMDNETADLSRIRRFGSMDEFCAPEVILQGELDRMARAVHNNYVDAGTGADSVQPWETLRETYRDASRSQADHLDVKLTAIGCRRIRRSGVPGPFAFTQRETERLTIMEHDRWCADRWIDGWRRGDRKDAIARTHPSLVPFELLSEDIKELDRRAVRNIPGIAAAAGFAIIRERRIGLGGVSLDGFDGLAGQARAENYLPVAVVPVIDNGGIARAETLAANGIAIIAVATVGIHMKLTPPDRSRLNAILGKADRVLFGNDAQQAAQLVRENSDVLLN